MLQMWGGESRTGCLLAETHEQGKGTDIVGDKSCTEYNAKVYSLPRYSLESLLL